MDSVLHIFGNIFSRLAFPTNIPVCQIISVVYKVFINERPIEKRKELIDILWRL